MNLKPLIDQQNKERYNEIIMSFAVILKTPLINVFNFDLEVTVKVQGMLWCSALTEKPPVS